MIKKLAYILCFSLIGGTFTSCEDALLSQVNPNSLTDGSFWKTEADFDKAVNALYGSLQLEYVSGSGLTFEMLRSDLAGTETWYSTQNIFTQLKWDSSSPYVENRWSQLYVGIFRANQILHYIENADFLTQEKKEQIIAQARFIRGYDYFFLANTYGGAVIHDKMASSAEEINIPFSSKDDVINKMVIPDFQAAQILPKVWPNGNDGHITWGAATAMLGKTYLFQKEWKLARECFKQLVESNLYELEENYMDNFTTDNEFNKESVFEVSFSDNYKPGNSGNLHDEIDGSEGVSIANQFASLLQVVTIQCYLPTIATKCLFRQMLWILMLNGQKLDI